MLAIDVPVEGTTYIPRAFKGAGATSNVFIAEDSSVTITDPRAQRMVEDFRKFLPKYHAALQGRYGSRGTGPDARDHYLGLKEEFKIRWTQIVSLLGPYDPKVKSQNPFFALKEVEKKKVKMNLSRECDAELAAYTTPATRNAKLDEMVVERCKNYKRECDRVAAGVPYGVMKIAGFNEIASADCILTCMDLSTSSLADLLEDKLEERAKISETKGEDEGQKAFHDEAWTGNVLEWVLNSALILKRWGECHGDLTIGNILFNTYGDVLVPVLSDVGDIRKTFITTIDRLMTKFVPAMYKKYEAQIFHPPAELEGTKRDMWCLIKSLYVCLTGHLTTDTNVSSYAKQYNPLITNDLGRVFSKGLSTVRPFETPDELISLLIGDGSNPGVIQSMGYGVNRLKIAESFNWKYEVLEGAAGLGDDMVYVVGKPSKFMRFRYEARTNQLLEAERRVIETHSMEAFIECRLDEVIKNETKNMDELAHLVEEIRQMHEKNYAQATEEEKKRLDKFYREIVAKQKELKELRKKDVQAVVAEATDKVKFYRDRVRFFEMIVPYLD